MMRCSWHMPRHDGFSFQQATALEAQQCVMLAVGGVHVLLVVAAHYVRVLQRLPQPRLQGAGALERRRNAQLLGVHLRD